MEGKRKVKCLVYSRVVGYIRPTDLWNKAKQQEFEERRTYDVKEFRRPPQEADTQLPA